MTHSKVQGIVINQTQCKNGHLQLNHINVIQ